MKKLDIIENSKLNPAQTEAFTKLLDLIQKEGGNIHRHSKNEDAHCIDPDSEHAYPITLLDEAIVLSGIYPSLEQVINWLDLPLPLEEKKSPCCGSCGG